VTDIQLQVYLLGVGAMIPAVAIGNQFAIGVGPLEVDGGDVPVQDIQVQIIDLNGPRSEPGPEFAQMGTKPVQCPSQPIVVSLLGRDAQHLRQHRLGQPVLDLIQRLGAKRRLRVNKTTMRPRSMSASVGASSLTVCRTCKSFRMG